MWVGALGGISHLVSSIDPKSSKTAILNWEKGGKLLPGFGLPVHGRF